jgi:hypothetical protein
VFETGSPRGSRCALALAIVVSVAAGADSAAIAATWPMNGVPVGPAGSHARSAPAIAADITGMSVGWIDGGPAGITTCLQRLTTDGQREFGWPDSGLSVLPMHENVVVLADGSGGVYVGADPSINIGGAMLTHISATGAVVLRWPLALPHTILGKPESARDDAGCTELARRAPPEQTLSTYETYLPRMAATPGGGIVAAWLHSMEFDGIELSDHVHLGRFKPNGEPQSGWQRYGIPVDNAEAMPPHQFEPQVCSDDSGGAYVAWVAHSPDPPHVTIHHVSGDNSRNSGFAVCTSCGPQDAIGIAPDGAGGVFVAWQDHRAPATQRTYLQRVSSDGSVPAGWPSDGLVLCPARSRGGALRHVMGAPVPGSMIVVDGTGGAYVAWIDLRDSLATGTDVYAQHVRGDGSLAAGWPSGGLAIAHAPGDQTLPSIVADGAGGLFLAWQDARAGGWDVYAQHVDASGTFRFGAGGIPLCDAPGDQAYPAVAANGAGEAFVAWVDARAATPNVYVSSLADHRVPALASLYRAEADRDRARLTWWLGDERSAATIERRTSVLPWGAIAVRRPDAEGWLEVEDRDVVAGGRYGYRLSIASATGTRIAGEAWIDIPAGATLALDGARPNPGRSPFLIGFELPDRAPATLELLDVSGRRLESDAVGSLGAGRHLLRIGRSGLPPGIYLVRLTSRERVLTTRACIVE